LHSRSPRRILLLNATLWVFLGPCISACVSEATRSKYAPHIDGRNVALFYFMGSYPAYGTLASTSTLHNGLPLSLRGKTLFLEPAPSDMAPRSTSPILFPQ
ncbi:hypothetical protein BGZ57DRAFT_995225, partial [Hyaloscypha finlandica]